MKIIENLTEYQNAGKYFLNLRQMEEEINYNNWETRNNLKLVKDIDYKIHDVSHRMNETQTCPTCGNENAKKWASEFCILKNEPTKACEQCITDEPDPVDEFLGLYER